MLTLTKNMCLLKEVLQTSIASKIQELSNWILKIDDGKLLEPNNNLVEVEIRKKIPILEFNDPIQAIVSTTYPNLIQNYTYESFFKCIAILTSRIEIVNEIN